jgi:hypothetical protein
MLSWLRGLCGWLFGAKKPRPMDPVELTDEESAQLHAALKDGSARPAVKPRRIEERAAPAGPRTDARPAGSQAVAAARKAQRRTQAMTESRHERLDAEAMLDASAVLEVLSDTLTSPPAPDPPGADHAPADFSVPDAPSFDIGSVGDAIADGACDFGAADG